MLLERGQFCALLCAVTLLSNVSLAEWVEMPQFSDGNKIYRIPPATRHKQLLQESSRSDEAGSSVHSADDQRINDSRIYHRVATMYYATSEKNTEIGKVDSALLSTTVPPDLFRDQIEDSFVDIDDTRPETSTGTVIRDKLDNKPSTESTNAARETARDTYYYNRTLKQDDTVLQYLPVDILESVHRTLRSQPQSLEGKLQFLRTFERTLMTEIESRLARAMAAGPSRKARGADYYGHDDHEDHSMGFPSIEGALMAISFLTFAVYLVRLVMLLFKNMNNQMTTTTAATVFLGKRKRSADFDDNAARILSNINDFDSIF